MGSMTREEHNDPHAHRMGDTFPYPAKAESAISGFTNVGTGETVAAADHTHNVLAYHTSTVITDVWQELDETLPGTMVAYEPTEKFYVRFNGGWVAINTGGSGTDINQLTGDVLAGPGSGSEVATVVGASGDFDVAGGITLHEKMTIAGTTVNLTVAGDSLPITHCAVALNASTPLTLTSAPTIANGTTGDTIFVFNLNSNAVTLQDETLSGIATNLKLNGASATLELGDCMMFRWSATVGKWMQVGSVHPVGSIKTAAIQDAAVTLAKLNTTGTPNVGVALRGDMSWGPVPTQPTPTFSVEESTGAAWLARFADSGYPITEVWIGDSMSSLSVTDSEQESIPAILEAEMAALYNLYPRFTRNDETEKMGSGNVSVQMNFAGDANHIKWDSVGGTYVGRGPQMANRLLAYRALTNAQTVNATPSIYSASGFTEADLYASVSGTNVPAGATVIRVPTARTVTDLVTNGTTTVTSATANFSSNDVGGFLLASGVLPASTRIVTYNSPTSVVVSAAALTSASGQTASVAGCVISANATASGTSLSINFGQACETERYGSAVSIYYTKSKTVTGTMKVTTNGTAQATFSTYDATLSPSNMCGYAVGYSIRSFNGPIKVRVEATAGTVELESAYFHAGNYTTGYRLLRADKSGQSFATVNGAGNPWVYQFIEKRQPQFVTIMLGRNDVVAYGDTPAELATQLETMVTNIRAKYPISSATNATVTYTSTTVTTATAFFTAGMSGMRIYGVGIPHDATMTYVNSTTATISSAGDLTAAGAGTTIYVGSTLWKPSILYIFQPDEKSTPDNWNTDYKDAMRDKCVELGIGWLDADEVVGGDWGVPDPLDLTADYIHPGDWGSWLIGKAVAERRRKTAIPRTKPLLIHNDYQHVPLGAFGALRFVAASGMNLVLGQWAGVNGGTPAATANGGILGQILLYGAEDIYANMSQGAAIRAKAEGLWTSSNNSAGIYFSTTNGTTASDKFGVTADGTFFIGPTLASSVFSIDQAGTVVGGIVGKAYMLANHVADAAPTDTNNDVTNAASIIWTDTIVGNSLNAVGDILRARYTLQLTNTAGYNPTLRITFGGVDAYAAATITTTATTGYAVVDVEIIRTGSSTCRVSVFVNGYSCTPNKSVHYAAITTGAALSANNDLVLRLGRAHVGDIIAKSGSVWVVRS